MNLREWRARERERARAACGAAFLEEARAWRKLKPMCDPYGDPKPNPDGSIPERFYPRQVRLARAIVAAREAKEYMARYSKSDALNRDLDDTPPRSRRTVFDREP